LADAILDVLRIAGDRNLGLSCRQHAEERYCASKIARCLLDDLGVVPVPPVADESETSRSVS
jgi:hypothetical protein